MKKEVFSSKNQEVNVKSAFTYMAKAALALIAFFAITTIAESQNFTNAGATATYEACATPTGGIIKMKSATGVFDGANEYGVSGKRIPGTVEWARTGSDQTIEPNYYERLTTSGGANKIFTDGADYYVSGEYLPADGNRNYNTSNFYYDGATAQTLFTESAAGNTYYNVFLTDAGKKTIAAGTTLLVTNTLRHQGTGGFDATGSLTTGNYVADAGTVTTLNGAGTNVFSITSNTVPSTINGSIAANSGEFSLDGSATVTVNATGSIAFANDADAKLNLAAGSQLDVIGGFTNAYDARTNMTFDVASTVKYSGDAQAIVSTVASKPYGNLTIPDGAGKTIAVGGANDDIYMAGNFTLTAGALALSSSVGGDSKLSMTTGTVTYGATDNSVFVQGMMERVGPLATGTNYTMNNAQTQVNFKTAGAPLTSFGMDIIPGATSNKYQDVDAAIDLKRQVRLAFAGTGKIDVLRIGYVSGDVPGTANESKIKVYEAFDNTKDKQNVIIKDYAGYITRSGSSGDRFVQLKGDNDTHVLNLIAAAGGGERDELSTGSDLVLSADARTRTIADGRWSNPAIWDEGVVPSATDDASVRNFVYAGIEGAAFGLSGYSDNERYGANDDQAVAKSITVESPNAAAGYPHPALVIGHDDSDLPAGFTFKTVIDPATAGSGLFNKNTTASALSDPLAKNTYLASTGTLMGVYIMSPNGALVPTLEASQVTNNGSFRNCGILGIGK